MTASPNAVYFATFMGLKGVWCLGAGASLTFDLPNPGGLPHEFKTIWIQITMHFHGTNPPISITTAPGSFVAGFQDLPIPGMGPNWIHRTVSLCISPPCPLLESIVIRNESIAPAEHVDIAQVVIETMCDPDKCPPPPPPVAPGDYDGDGFHDHWDNAPGIPNPNQSDCDGDDLGDVSDLCEICPPGTPAKNEPCGSDTNGGCNTPGHPTTPLACNETLCGDAWAKAGARDTDWYDITLQDSNGDGFADLILDLCTSLPLVMAVFDAVCPPSPPAAYAVTEADLDRPAQLFICLPAPATYRIFIAPGRISGAIFDGFPCNGLANEYWLSAWCADPCDVCGVPGADGCCDASPNNRPGCNDAECCAEVCAVDSFCCNVVWDALCGQLARQLCRRICCKADLNGDGIVDGADLGVLLSHWGANFITAADLDGDCDVDGADLGLLLGQWGPC